MDQLIHVQKSSNDTSVHVLLLLLPPLIFVLTLAFLTLNSPKKYSATTSSQSVLGEEAK